MPLQGDCSLKTLTSLKHVDEALINDDLLESLICSIVDSPLSELTGRVGKVAPTMAFTFLVCLCLHPAADQKFPVVSQIQEHH